MIDWLKKHRRCIAWAVGSAVALGVYLSCCKSLWKHNPLFDPASSKTYDQLFYIHSANTIASGYAGLLPRSRMPLYPWLLQFVADPKKDDLEMLTPFIRLNVGISVLCLIAVYFMLRGFLGTWLAVLTTLVAAFRVFVFKAVLVQPEILFFTLYLGLFLLSLRYLKTPSWRLAVVGGLLAGFTHLTKGSALPMVGIFLVLAFVREFIGWRKSREQGSAAGAAVLLLRPAVFLAAFLCVAGTWLRNSHRAYNNPFYDPNTRYYFWAESPREMTAMQRFDLAIGKPRFGPEENEDDLVQEFLPKWAPDARLREEIQARSTSEGPVLLEGEYEILPGFKNWRATHSWRDAVERVWAGLFSDRSDDPAAGKRPMSEAERNKLLVRIPSLIPGNALLGHNRDHPNGYWDFLSLMFCSATILLAIAYYFSWRAVRDALAENWLPIVFAVACLTLTGLSYAWWAQISNRNRFFLTLYLPLVASLGMLVRFACGQVPLQAKIVWHRRSFILNAYTLFLSVCTAITFCDLNDPLNRGRLHNPRDLSRQIVQ